jgi:hypothetical protein
MPSTSFDAAPVRTSWAEFWLYRIGAYLLINFIDDPVWLALIFC